MSLPVETTESAINDVGVGKSRLGGLLLASMLLAIFAFINLPFQYVESDVEWIGYLEVRDSGHYQAYQKLPTMAGWPLRYWIRYTDEDLVQDRLWSPEKLGLNMALGCAIALAIYFFMQWRRRLLIASSRSQRTRLLLDCCVAILIIGIPVSIFLRECYTTYDHRQIARKLARVGSAGLACWMPAALAEHLPAGVRRNFVRIREIHIYGASQTTAGVITSLPTIVSYHDYNGEYDSLPLQNLMRSPHFCALQLSNREIDDADVDAIANMNWLVQLRLSQTNLNGGQLDKFDHLRLRHVDLSFTDLVLSELGSPSWSQCVENLWLSRPGQGTEAAVSIEGWPELKELRVRRRSALLNDAVLSVRLVDLPRLENLYLDRVQKHDLVLRNVPRLAFLEEGVADLRYIIGGDALVPGLTWVRSLEIEGADSLTEFSCYAKDLERFSIRSVRNLRSFSVGSYLITVLGDVVAQDADRDKCQMWIREIGEMDGPSNLVLEQLPLAGVDLKPLTKNQRIRHLQLGGTGVSFEQVKQLQGLDQLEELSIRTTPLQKDQLTWVLDRFSKIKKLTTDVNGLTRLDLRGRGDLRDLRVTPMGSLEDIQIVDLPRLKASIRLTNAPQSLDIRGVPLLRGLAVEGPWPQDAKLAGLRDLEWFTGGGDQVTDQVVEEVLNCRNIERLALVYPSASSSTLRKIGGLKNLTFLAVPGGDIDDAVVRDWNGLKSLWEINLDDTKVSVETFAWLSRIDSLRRLSIKRVPLSDAAADALAELTQISELYLSGAEMDASKLRRVIEMGSLETLDISGWNITDELVDTLCSDRAQLKHLIIRDTEIGKRAFERILASDPNLYIEVAERPDFVDLSTSEELDRRAIVLNRVLSTGWRLLMRPQDDVYQPVAAGFRKVESEEDDSPIPRALMSKMTRQRFSQEQPAPR